MNRGARSTGMCRSPMYIQEFAETVELPVSTIRFYERKRLLTEEHFSRHDNNYRVYNEWAIERVRLIRGAQQAGFTIREILNYVSDWELNVFTHEQKRAFFLDKLTEIEVRIQGLVRMREYINAKIDNLKAHDERS